MKHTTSSGTRFEVVDTGETNEMLAGQAYWQLADELHVTSKMLTTELVQSAAIRLNDVFGRVSDQLVVEEQDALFDEMSAQLTILREATPEDAEALLAGAVDFVLMNSSFYGQYESEERRLVTQGEVRGVYGTLLGMDEPDLRDYLSSTVTPDGLMAEEYGSQIGLITDTMLNILAETEAGMALTQEEVVQKIVTSFDEDADSGLVRHMGLSPEETAIFAGVVMDVIAEKGLLAGVSWLKPAFEADETGIESAKLVSVSRFVVRTAALSSNERN